jgi:hypothetical protein
MYARGSFRPSPKRRPVLIQRCVRIHVQEQTGHILPQSAGVVLHWSSLTPECFRKHERPQDLFLAMPGRMRPAILLHGVASVGLSVKIRNNERYSTDNHRGRSLLSEHEEVFGACSVYVLCSRRFCTAISASPPLPPPCHSERASPAPLLPPPARSVAVR